MSLPPLAAVIKASAPPYRLPSLLIFPSLPHRHPKSVSVPQTREAIIIIKYISEHTSPQTTYPSILSSRTTRTKMHSASVLRPHLMEHLRHPLKTLSRTNTNEEPSTTTAASSSTNATTTTSPKRAGTFPLLKHSHDNLTQQTAERTTTPPIPPVTKATTLPLNPSHSSHSSHSSTSSNNSNNSSDHSGENKETKRLPKHSPESFYAAIHEGNSARTTVPGTARRDRRASKTSVVDSASLLGVR